MLENHDEWKENKITAEIKDVENVLYMPLSIPHYQRPYRWETKNVLQLLEDINNSKCSNKKSYRIGSLILHDQKGKYDIVDGQQRITTLLLLQIACGEKTDTCLTFKHSDSFVHIRQNYTFIVDWLKKHCHNSGAEYWNYVKTHCEMVIIIVSDLSEAFQMFDSQNGRGKELEAYNLLKAYHIRAMEQNSREEKIKCDRRWESATQYDATPTIMDDPNIDLLKQLFDEQLYRSRIWTRNKEAYKFSKRQIDEFKGFTIDKNHQAIYPYQNPQLLQYLTAKFYRNVLEGTIAMQSRFLSGDSDHIDPFANINQMIVNGKSFFDYVETYTEIYKEMFLNLGSYQLSEFKAFYYQYCLDYDHPEKESGRLKPTAFLPQGKAQRLGDTYLREAYKSLAFVLFDKFGETGLMQYYIILYRIVYLDRITKRQVKYNAVAQLPHQYFKIIYQAKSLSDLQELIEILSTKLEQARNSGILNENIIKISDSVKDIIVNDKTE